MHPKMFILSAAIVAIAAGAACPMADLRKRQIELETAPHERQVTDNTESNCGPVPCTSFDNSQLVDVSPGSGHEYRAPGHNDLRGPCPGLNAAANHGFLNRNGMTDIVQATNGLREAYGMGPDLGTFLAIFAVITSGDPITQKWSIGGPFGGIIPGIGQQPSGLSKTHSIYEGDGSPTRFDSYMNHGDAASLNVTRFGKVCNRANSEGIITLHAMRLHSQDANHDCKNNNAYCFLGPASTSVALGAANFIPTLFSNHSAEKPNGYLSIDIFKSFFAVTGEKGSFNWVPGTERIPDNWYRRVKDNDYGITQLATDIGLTGIVCPECVTFGGNTGQPNTYTGVKVEDLTGGVLNAQTLLEGNNLACFLFQTLQITGVTRLNDPLLTASLNLLLAKLGPLLAPLRCPQLYFNNTPLVEFSGYSYGRAKL